MGIFPLAGLLVEGRDPGRRRISSAGAGGYKFMLVMGLIGAAADLRLHDPGHLAHASSASTAAQRHARTSRPGHDVPLLILAGRRHRRSASPTCPTRSSARRPDVRALRFEHFVEPTRLLPERIDARRVQRLASPSVSTVVGRRSASSLAYLWYWQGQAARHGLTERNKARPRPATRCSRTSTTSTTSTPTSSSAASRARSPGPSYWFNQNVIDGVVNGVGDGARSQPASASTTTSTRASSTASSTARARPPRARGQVLRKHPDRQGPAVRRLPVRCGAAVLAAIFVVIVKSE